MKYLAGLFLILLVYLYLEKQVYETFMVLSPEDEDYTTWEDSFRDEARQSGPIVYTNMLVNHPAEMTGPPEFLHTPEGDYNLTRSQFLPHFAAV